MTIERELKSCGNAIDVYAGGGCKHFHLKGAAQLTSVRRCSPMVGSHWITLHEVAVPHPAKAKLEVNAESLAVSLPVRAPLHVRASRLDRVRGMAKSALSRQDALYETCSAGGVREPRPSFVWRLVSAMILPAAHYGRAAVSEDEMDASQNSCSMDINQGI